MLYKQFKTQPVQAFYKLLIFSIIKILIASIIVSILYFLIIKLLVTNLIDKNGISQISEIVKQQQNASDMISQSKKMQDLILKYPQIVPLMLFGFGILLIATSFLISFTQKIIKDKIMDKKINIGKSIIPDSRDLNILIYVLLFLPVFLLVFSLSIASIRVNPLISIFSLFFMIMVILRSVLLIPGIVIGDMKFREAMRYSFQNIGFGRAVKIAIFGVLIFFMLTIVLNAILYFPMNFIKFDKSDLFYNFLILFFQSGIVSVGLASLFTRYANFEEVF
ncbi:MAG: hypothetical protein IT243_07665 [Bacteroidia bacterium]|nr:hypothetical protein [Bacteroidia bacterium]